jgi:Cd2+/Zn2+-exporting ATPase
MLERAGASSSLLLATHLVTYVFGGAFAVLAIAASFRRRQIEVDLLMVLAALGAAYVDAWTEGAILLFLFSLSNVLQNYAMRRTEQAIASLLELRPDTVLCRRGAEMVTLPLDDVAPGETMVVRPGDRVALDATIVHGEGSFDESALTGESMPVQKRPGDQIFAGTVNQNGAIDALVTKTAASSTLARMIALVHEARERKARTQSFLETFEQRYAVGVIVAVGLYAVLMPVLTGVEFGANFYRAMTLLTVASPCALVIGVPAALLSAIAGAARQGVLFKGGAHLEDLARIKVVALDKTGTITYGKPDVGDVLPQPGIAEMELLRVVARAEQASEHPIARAVRAYAERQGVLIQEAEQFEAISGMGVRAVWDGATTLVGAPRLMERFGLAVPPELVAELDRLAHAGRGAGLLANRDGRWLGIVTVMDRERPGMAAKLAELRAAGVEHIVMLTGDHHVVANAVAARVGIDEVHAELLPEQKLSLIGDLQRRYGPTAMVGDGINDAPALAAADIGIAMGAAGTDVAMETAGIVLMRDDLGAIASAVRISKRARRIVWQNITFALAVIVVMAVSTLVTGVPLPLGVVSHEGSTVIVVMNGLRLLTRHA